jgi:hypothetical protein
VPGSPCVAWVPGRQLARAQGRWARSIGLGQAGRIRAGCRCSHQLPDQPPAVPAAFVAHQAAARPGPALPPAAGWLSARRQDCGQTEYDPLLSKATGLLDFAGSGVVHMVGGSAGAPLPLPAGQPCPLPPSEALAPAVSASPVAPVPLVNHLRPHCHPMDRVHSFPLAHATVSLAPALPYHACSPDGVNHCGPSHRAL